MSVAEKKFQRLDPLTPGSASILCRCYSLSYLSALVHGYSLLRPQLNQAYFSSIFDVAKEFHVEIEGHREYHPEMPFSYAHRCADTETGPGVFETALAYTTALRMADNAILFKFLVKSIGMKYGVLPSFMAKPWGNVGFIILS